MSNISNIPKGDYCYSYDEHKKEQVLCPYWSLREDKPEQLNGYCSFLKKGDWELSPEFNKRIKIKRAKNPDLVGKTASEVFGDDWPSSMLWDQVKECGENMREE